MSGINLTGAMRSNLLSLNNTQNLINQTQNRLATGLKVGSALDNPQNFFQAQTLSNRASDLAGLQDKMNLGIRTLQAADEGIKSMTKVVQSMIGLARQARDLSEDDTEGRERLGAQFDVLKEQLEGIAKDANYNGVNLLNGDELKIVFNTAIEDDERTELIINDEDGELDKIELVDDVDSLSDADGFSTNEAIDDIITELEEFVQDLRTSAAVLGTNLTVVQVRNEFTKNMINTLKSGADDLTLANENEEAANLLALQTRQQLGIQALSLASQSQQSILRLF